MAPEVVAAPPRVVLVAQLWPNFNRVDPTHLFAVHCGMNMSRQRVAFRYRTSWVHGEAALTLPWIEPALPSVLDSPPAC